MNTTEIRNTWKSYLAKPNYPKIDATYNIKTGTLPIENPENKDQMIVQTDQGRILLWNPQFRELVEKLAKTEFADTQVIFRRAADGKRSVEIVTEGL